MSDGSEGVGGSGGGNGGAGSAGLGSDGLGNAADSVSGALGQAADALSEAVSSALGAVADAAGLGDALGQLGDMLGVDARDLQGLVGAAMLGAITGGLPGAIAAVTNGLLGGSITSAARDSVSSNLPASMQPLANLAIDAFAGRIPGAASSTSLQGVLDTLGSGVLGNGRASIGDLGAVARALDDVSQAARTAIDATTRGDFGSAIDAATALDGVLGSQFAQGRGVVADVAGMVGAGNGAYPGGDRGAFGNAVEAMALATSRVLGGR